MFFIKTQLRKLHNLQLQSYKYQLNDSEIALENHMDSYKCHLNLNNSKYFQYNQMKYKDHIPHQKLAHNPND